MTELLDRPDMIPTEADAELAATASRALAGASAESLSVRLDDGKELQLPKSVTPFLTHLLTEMAQGNAVTLIPVHAELTTQEAADYLNVSRPYLIKLLEQDKIPFHKVGTHRRVRFTDLEAYRRRAEEEHRAAMDELVAHAQELGMGY